MISTLDLGSDGVVVLSDMTVAELHNLRTKLEKDLTSIKVQIRSAVSRYKRTGIAADEMWFDRVNKAKLIKGQQINAINSEIGLRKHDYAIKFLDVARRELPQETFTVIQSLANSE